jgi:hypothetical protein
MREQRNPLEGRTVREEKIQLTGLNEKKAGRRKNGHEMPHNI